jgi:hypothetical protein
VCLQVASDKDDCVAGCWVYTCERRTNQDACGKNNRNQSIKKYVIVPGIPNLGNNVGLPLIPQNSFCFLLYVQQPGFSTIHLLRVRKLKNDKYLSLLKNENLLYCRMR